MRPTTKRRIVILAASTVGLAVTLGGVYEFRQYQINAKTLAYRAEGMDAFKHGDFAKALIPLSKYNERHQNDAETLFAFGKARSRVEAPNNRHLGEAIQYYRRGLELQPDNMEARHQLLDLYSNAGYNAEAIILSDELLKKNSKDVDAVRAKAKALASRRQLAEALDTSLKLNQLAPEDVEGQGLTLYLMSPWCLNKPSAEILGRARKLLAAHPDDERFVLLQGLAYHCILDDNTAREWYLKAAANPPADPEFVKVCTQVMDEVGLFDKSQDLLERASAQGHDPRMLRMLIQRLWQNGRYIQVVERLKDVNPSNTSADAHLLAYRAYSLYQLRRDAEAKPIVDALAARKDDDVALAWAKALSARFEDPDANPRDKIQQYQAALVRDPGNSTIRYMMGESYARLGETELALQCWGQVVRDIPSWSTPRVQIAYLLAATGRTQTAVENAIQAYSAGRNLGSAIGLVVALATQLDTGTGTFDAAKVMAYAAEIQQKVPGEPQTLPIYVDLIARTGAKGRAAALVEGIMAVADTRADITKRVSADAKSALKRAEKAFGKAALAREAIEQAGRSIDDAATGLSGGIASKNVTDAVGQAKAAVAAATSAIDDAADASATSGKAVVDAIAGAAAEIDKARTALATELKASPDKAAAMKKPQEQLDGAAGSASTAATAAGTYTSLAACAARLDKGDLAGATAAVSGVYPVNTDLWLRLASVSRGERLGLEDEILGRADRESEGQSPQLALARALMLAESGKPDDGLLQLSRAADAATRQQAAWKVAVAQFHEQLRDPKAHDAWVEVGDKFPQDLSVQSTIVDLPDSSSAWADRDFIDRTIARLRALTGDEGFHYKLAECRWLLNSPNRKRDSAIAASKLSDIVNRSPGLVAPRLYLAKAFENLEDTSTAIVHLRAAAKVNPENESIALDLARLLLEDGRFDDAKAYLDRAARSASDAATRRRVAIFYARQGDLDAAIRLLSSPTAGEADSGADALLADLYRRKGNFDEATKLYERLASGKGVDAATLAAAADYFATHGREDQARAAIGRLSELKLPAGRRDAIVAEYTEKHGSKEAAAGLYKQAVDANPTDPDLWRALVAFQFRQSHFDQAAATCDCALAKLPGNEDLASLKVQALALRTTGGGVDTDALVAELSKDPRNAAARDSLAAYSASRKNNDPPDRAVQKLRRVADQYPRFLPVQTQVVRMYLRLGKVSDALNVATRAMDNFPNDPEPASLVTSIYGGTGKWSDVLRVAQEWRRRSLENPVEPDLAIARARIEMNQPAEAIQTLKPYMEAANANPDKYNMVIGTYAQALIVDDRESDAAALLTPFLPRSEEWKISTIRLAASIHNPTAAAHWIEQFAAAVPEDSLRARYEVANAWYVAGHRFPNHQKQYLGHARDVITPLTKRPDTTAVVMLMAGSIAETLNDPGDAIAAYRRALQLDPKQPIAQNNLAYLLMTQNRDLDEARRLAESAVVAAPDEAGYYDTLARVYEKIGNRGRAIATYQKVLDLEPTNVQAMVPTIRLLRADGQRDAARAMMAKLETLLQANPALQTPDVDVQALRQQL